MEEYVHNQLNAEQQRRIKNLFDLIGNFCSELSLEILATTDFILADNPDYSLDDVLRNIGAWSDRKNMLFERSHVEIAYKHLRQHKDILVTQ